MRNSTRVRRNDASTKNKKPESKEKKSLGKIARFAMLASAPKFIRNTAD